jgi:hypothetical protein
MTGMEWVAFTIGALIFATAVALGWALTRH